MNLNGNGHLRKKKTRTVAQMKSGHMRKQEVDICANDNLLLFNMFLPKSLFNIFYILFTV